MKNILALCLLILAIASCSVTPPTEATSSITPTGTEAVFPTETIVPYSILTALPPASILFERDFESGPSNEFQNWDVIAEQNGNHVLCNGDSANGLTSFIGDDLWENYGLEMRVQEIGQGNDPYVSLLARFDPNTYVGYYGALNFQTFIADLAYNEPYKNLGNQEYRTDAHTWHTLRTEVAGNKIRFSVDNVLIGEAIDSQRSQGQAGFGVSPHLMICVDNIRVWALQENGQIGEAPTPIPTTSPEPTAMVVDAYPEVWSHNGPQGSSYEYKVNCGPNYPVLETCFLWDLDQVIVTTPAGKTAKLMKDFNINSYSGEVTRRWVLYGPDGAGLPRNGTYTFTYIKNNETVYVQQVDYSQSVLTFPTQLEITQVGNELHATWQPPEGVASGMWYKVIVFNASSGEFVTSESFPWDARSAVLPNPPLAPGVRYKANVSIFSSGGFANSQEVRFTWKVP